MVLFQIYIKYNLYLTNIKKNYIMCITFSTDQKYTTSITINSTVHEKKHEDGCIYTTSLLCTHFKHYFLQRIHKMF
jgi:hypothetical protein